MKEKDMRRQKMYILVKDSVPLGHAVNSAAHASLSCYLKFQSDFQMQLWMLESFRKVSCIVSDEEFEYAKTLGHEHIVFTEHDLPGPPDKDGREGMETALAFLPSSNYHPFFRSLKLYGSEPKVKEKELPSL